MTVRRYYRTELAEEYCEVERPDPKDAPHIKGLGMDGARLIALAKEQFRNQEGSWFVASLVFGVQADTPHSTVFGAPIGWALVLLGTVLLFLSLLGTSSRYLPDPVVYLGRISYGLYLFHELVYFLIFHTWKVPLTRLSQVLRLSEWRRGSRWRSIRSSDQPSAMAALLHLQ